MIKKKRSSSGYWFTIVAANGQVLATSETYTTAAMRDKGIEAVKEVVCEEEVKRVIASHVKDGYYKGRLAGPSDTFHLENAKGKIKKH